MTRVLGIAGGPRRGGNSEQLLDAALAGAASRGATTEKLVAAELAIAPCDGMRHCDAAGVCHIADAMQQVYPVLRDLDHLIVAAPVYFMGLPSPLKALIDRCQALWVVRFQLHRPVARSGPRRRGLFIATAHSEQPAMYRPAISEIKALFNTIDVSYRGELLVGGVDQPEDVHRDPAPLTRAFAAGAALVGDIQEVSP